MSLTPIETVREELLQGRAILLADEESDHAVGFVCMAAEKVAAEHVNFMTRHAGGVLYLALEAPRLRELGFGVDAAASILPGRAPVGAPVGANSALGLEVSAAGRAHTIRTAAGRDAGPRDFVTPGNVLPIQASKGGVLVKAGPAEAAVDLAALCGLQPAAVICQVLSEDGAIAEGAALKAFAERHALRMASVVDLVASRLRNEATIRRVWEEDFPTIHGKSFKAILYRTNLDPFEHMALVKGEVEGRDDVLVRVHSECLTGDVFSSQRCDCGEQLRTAIRIIDREECGVIVYMHQEGRGIGLTNKIKAYALQDRGRDTVEANLELGFEVDLRDYGVAAEILRHLGVRRLRLLTNNPRKIVSLEGYGMSVSQRVPLEVEPHGRNTGYLQTKRDKLGHLLSRVGDEPAR